MDDYREMLKTGQVITDLLPIPQERPELDINMIDADGKIETEGGKYPQNPETDLISGKGDGSKVLDNIAADGANVIGKALVVEIEAQNVSVGSLVDEKALDLQNGTVKNGREGEEFMEADDHMESQKKSAPSKEKESE